MCSEELNIVCFYMITSICKVVTLIFYVLAEQESKKMWSKFDNVTPTLLKIGSNKPGFCQNTDTFWNH